MAAWGACITLPEARGRPLSASCCLIRDRLLMPDDHPLKVLVGELPHVVVADAMVLRGLAPAAPTGCANRFIQSSLRSTALLR